MILDKAQIVKVILKESTLARDDDNILLTKVWERESSGTFSKSIFFLNMSKGRYSSAESITRCRRKLQEEDPTLRGEKYNKRHKKAKESV